MRERWTSIGAGVLLSRTIEDSGMQQLLLSIWNCDNRKYNRIYHNVKKADVEVDGNEALNVESIN